LRRVGDLLQVCDVDSGLAEDALYGGESQPFRLVVPVDKAVLAIATLSPLFFDGKL